MRIRTIGSTLMLCVLGVAVALAADPQVGTWKLNEAKSKMTGMAKNPTVVYTETADGLKVAIDGFDATGKAFHSEWSGKADGKDYPVTGDPATDTRSYTKVDDHTLAFASKKDGKATISGKVVVSADGKTRTVTASGMDSSGMKTSLVAVYDKQ